MKLFSRYAPSVALAFAMLMNSSMAQDDLGDDVIVVRGTLIPDQKKSTAEISSFLDADDFQRAGDSDIASALRRVTGLSIQDGRFVVVRGLNERYSSATLNGLPLPSPEPLRRAAPLDLFPTSVIASTLVQKTFSPQFSGEFGGGLIELRSKSIPDDDFLDVSIGFSANSLTTMASGLFYEGSNRDVFGYDDGLRDIPDAAKALFSGERATTDEQNRIDASFEQKKTLLISDGNVPFNGKGSVALGKRLYTGGDLAVGTVFFLGYDNDWQTRDGERGRIEGTSNSYTSDFLTTRQEVSLSALSSTGIEFNPNHSVQLTGLLARKSLKEAQIQNRFFPGEDRNIRLEQTDFIDRELWQGQLTGQHVFPNFADLELGWKLGYGEAERDQPYKRQTGFVLDKASGNYLFTVEEGRSNIDFRFLKDENTSVGVDFKLPIDIFGTFTEFKFGAAYTDTTRNTARRLFEFRGAFPSEIVASRADLIFLDKILELDGPRVEFRSTRGEPDNFNGNLEVSAAYIGADIELGPFVRAAIGGRFEESTQATSTYTTTSPKDVSVFDPITAEYFLPAVTLTWIPAGNFQVRGAYSQTITRPQFRELSPSIFTDPNTDQTFVGNPFLKNTEINNYDIRAEWYFRRGEFVTVGLFYKELTNAIEEARVSQGESVRTTFVNAPTAELFGVEAEFEKNFALEDIFSESDFWNGKELVFKTNYTYSDGTASDAGTIIVPNISGQGVTPSERAAGANIIDGSRLAGLSQHLFNIQLGIETENNTKVTLAANYASERTLIRGEGTSVGAGGGLQFTPSVVESVPTTLDFIMTQPFTIGNGGLELTIKIQNLLDENFTAFYDATKDTPQFESDSNYQFYDLGRTYSIGLKRSF